MESRNHQMFAIISALTATFTEALVQCAVKVKVSLSQAFQS